MLSAERQAAIGLAIARVLAAPAGPRTHLAPGGDNWSHRRRSLAALKSDLPRGSHEVPGVRTFNPCCCPRERPDQPLMAAGIPMPMARTLTRGHDRISLGSPWKSTCLKALGYVRAP